MGTTRSLIDCVCWFLVKWWRCLLTDSLVVWCTQWQWVWRVHLLPVLPM